MQELAPLFPSRTHPALPIAVQILSTLRSQTAPGRGNDLRAEERAALVGVAALLGCERVQSHDLSESGVQRASSVSPAHFRSALTSAKRILAASESNSALTPRRGGTTPTKHSASASTSTSPIPLRPTFTTPRKVRNTSNRDYGDLLTPHAHSPAMASPLRQDFATSTRDDDPPTPTKKTPRATPSMTSAARRDREREGAALFEQHLRGTHTPVQDANPFIAPAVEVESVVRRAERVERAVRRRRLRPRQDWTFREKVWRVSESSRVHLAALLKEEEGVPTEATTFEEAILAAWA